MPWTQYGRERHRFSFGALKISSCTADPVALPGAKLLHMMAASTMMAAKMGFASFMAMAVQFTDEWTDSWREIAFHDLIWPPVPSCHHL